MKKKLVTAFRAKVVRYNFGSSFSSITKDFDRYPTINQLMEFLEDTNRYDGDKDFETTIHVETFYKVENIK